MVNIETQKIAYRSFGTISSEILLDIGLFLFPLFFEVHTSNIIKGLLRCVIAPFQFFGLFRPGGVSWYLGDWFHVQPGCL